jgi:Ner family transcriptional regulator
MTHADKRPVWDAHSIRAEVHRRGKTLSKIALEAGLTESICRAALARPQPQGENAISAYLGISLHDLWPDRYDAEGGRIRHVRDENSHDRDETHRLNGQAA